MRRALVALALLDLVAAGLLVAVDRQAERATCVPLPEPQPTAMRILSQPSDGCDWLRARRALDLQPWLMLASAGGAGAAAGWESRWRVVALVPALALLVYLAPVAAFALWWRSECGPLESYVGGCASLAWLHLPWVALALGTVGAVAVAATRTPQPSA